MGLRKQTATLDRLAVRTVGSLTLADELQKERLTQLVEDTGDKLRVRRAKFGRWKWTDYGLGALGAVLAALSGAVGLGGLIPESWPLLAQKVPGLIALTAAVVTAIGTGLDPEKRLVAIGTERGPWGELRNDVLAFVTEAGRRDQHASAEGRGWFAVTLDHLVGRFCALEQANAAARGAAQG